MPRAPMRHWPLPLAFAAVVTIVIAVRTRRTVPPLPVSVQMLGPDLTWPVRQRAKECAIDGVINGRLTLAEAAADFQVIDAAPLPDVVKEQLCPGGSEEDVYRCIVVNWIKRAAPPGEPRSWRGDSERSWKVGPDAEPTGPWVNGPRRRRARCDRTDAGAENRPPDPYMLQKGNPSWFSQAGSGCPTAGPHPARSRGFLPYGRCRWAANRGSSFQLRPDAVHGRRPATKSLFTPRLRVG